MAVHGKTVGHRELRILRKTVRQGQNTIGACDQVIANRKGRLASKLTVELVINRGIIKDAVPAANHYVALREWFPRNANPRRKVVAVRVDQSSREQAGVRPAGSR